MIDNTVYRMLYDNNDNNNDKQRKLSFLLQYLQLPKTPIQFH